MAELSSDVSEPKKLMTTEDRRRVGIELAKTFAVMAGRGQSDGDAKTIIAIYLEDLIELPTQRVIEALGDFRRGAAGDGKWAPTVGQIIAHVNAAKTARMFKAMDAYQAVLNIRKTEIDAAEKAAFEQLNTAVCLTPADPEWTLWNEWENSRRFRRTNPNADGVGYFPTKRPPMTIEEDREYDEIRAAIRRKATEAREFAQNEYHRACREAAE